MRRRTLSGWRGRETLCPIEVGLSIDSKKIRFNVRSSFKLGDWSLFWLRGALTAATAGNFSLSSEAQMLVQLADVSRDRPRPLGLALFAARQSAIVLRTPYRIVEIETESMVRSRVG